jgi:hypothetical protein
MNSQQIKNVVAKMLDDAQKQLDTTTKQEQNEEYSSFETTAERHYDQGWRDALAALLETITTHNQ